MNNYTFNENEFLKPENMLMLYARGAFPMADDIGNINWYMPEIRTIIPLDNYNYPRSLRKFIDRSGFDFRFDTDYLNVIKNCADRESTWISDKLIEAYKNLYELGNLHSVEVWQKNNLVGGLYGISFRGAFFGESMFSKVSQASKAALIKLIERLNERNFILLDVQYQTEHLSMFGAKEIPFNDYETLLLRSYSIQTYFK